MEDVLVKRLRKLTENITPLRKALATRVSADNGVHTVRLYSTDVFRYDENTGELTLDNGGWVTNTTAARMEKAFEEYGLKGIHVSRKQGQMYLDINGIKIPFDGDSITVNLNDMDNIVDEYLQNYKKGDIILRGTSYTELPYGITNVKGNLDLRNSQVNSLPEGLVVTGYICIGDNPVKLPEKFKAKTLMIDNVSSVEYVPKGADVETFLIDGAYSFSYYFEMIEQFPELADPSWEDLNKVFDEE